MQKTTLGTVDDTQEHRKGHLGDCLLTLQATLREEAHGLSGLACLVLVLLVLALALWLSLWWTWCCGMVGRVGMILWYAGMIW